MSSDNQELETQPQAPAEVAPQVETEAVSKAETEAAAKADKQQRAERARVLLGQLAERYPACFHRDPKAVQPLAIGIQQKLRAELNADPALADTPGWLLRQALAIYTRSGTYVRALVERKPRLNLDGSEAGEVSDQEHAHALERQAEIEARRAARGPRRRPQGRRPQEGGAAGPRGEAEGDQAAQPAGDRPRRARADRPQGQAAEGQRREGQPQNRRPRPQGPRRGKGGNAPRNEPRRFSAPTPQAAEPAETFDPNLSPEERTRLKLEALAKKFSRD